MSKFKVTREKKNSTTAEMTGRGWKAEIGNCK